MADANQDPSMEEILASIKRVIADDGRAVMAASRAGRSSPRIVEPELKPEEPAEEDVLSSATCLGRRSADVARSGCCQPPVARGACSNAPAE
jgi:cell pole-organizing protein PopZ